MLKRFLNPTLFKRVHNVRTTPFKRTLKVTQLGSTGGIGQPLSLLLKQSPLIKNLALYDLQNAPGLAVDLSHIETPVCVTGHSGPDELPEALKHADIVVITAGKPRKKDMTRMDLFCVNAEIIRNLICAISKHCPEALICIITNPVNALVPLAAALMCENGTFDQHKLFGVTMLDIVRTNTFIAQLKCLNPLEVNCPVIGGHAGQTIIPVFSQCCPCINLTCQERKDLICRIQNGAMEVLEAKDGQGTATLSMAFAAARFVFALSRGLKGDKDVVECAYVKSDVTDSTYFSNPLILGKCGIEKNLGLGELTPEECEMVEEAIPLLKTSIEVGEDFIHNSS